MLSDRERETLHEIQRRFLDEDPDLVRSFLDVEQRQSHDRHRPVCTIAIVLAVIPSVLMPGGMPAGARYGTPTPPAPVPPREGWVTASWDLVIDTGLRPADMKPVDRREIVVGGTVGGHRRMR